MVFAGEGLVVLGGCDRRRCVHGNGVGWERERGAVLGRFVPRVQDGWGGCYSLASLGTFYRSAIPVEWGIVAPCPADGISARVVLAILCTRLMRPVHTRPLDPEICFAHFAPDSSRVVCFQTALSNAARDSTRLSRHGTEGRPRQAR